MKKIKGIFAIVLVLILSFSFVSCNEKSDKKEETSKGSGTNLGKTITAVMTTTLGDITLELYPDKAPKTVENFTTHAKNGYFNGIKFHRVIKDFMIQGGDPTATGMGGESIWGKPFADEFDPALKNYRGALSMANSGPNTNGSQFFIVQAGPEQLPADQLEEMIKTYSLKLTAEEKAKYIKEGGTPWLDGKHTVFGYVTQGMDVVDKIANVTTDKQGKPAEDIKIISVKISE